MRYPIILLLASLNAFAANNLGQEMVTIAKPSGATASVSVFNEPGAYSWDLTFNVLSQNIASSGQISTISWRAFNTQTNIFLNTWTEMSPISTCPAGCTISFTAATSDKGLVGNLYSQMKHLTIVFSVNNSAMSPTHFISLEKLCATPSAVLNLTTLENGCP